MSGSRNMRTKVSRTALIVPLIQPTAGAMRSAMRRAELAGAEMVECRLDFLTECNETDVEAILKDRPLPAIVTYRPVRQGGRYAGDESERLEILAAAARLGADYIDVEMDAGAANLSALRKTCRIIISHHDFGRRPADLDSIVAALNAADADVVKVAFAADGPEDALAALKILHEADRPTIALAMGEAGLVSRILAGKFGAFGTFAALEQGAESAPGQLTVEQMRGLYRWDSTGPATAVYGVIGCPVAHSMSPAIHNAAFAAAGIDAVYAPLRIEPGEENFNRFMDAVADSPWAHLRGFSVTIPHKENALARVATNTDELSRRIGAINTIAIAPDGSLTGTNTDYAAAVDALCSAMAIRREDLAGREVAVIGAGGAARAIVAALVHYRAGVTIYNRTFSRAERLAEEFGGKARPLEESAEVSAEIVFNCTSVGMHPNIDQTPLPAEALSRVKVVFDTVYNPPRTRLLREAADAGCLCVSGVEMFVNQAVAQFEIWTETKAPRELMREVVMRHLARPHQQRM